MAQPDNQARMEEEYWEREREAILGWMRLHRRDLLVFCSAIFFGLVAHLYSLTNPLGSDDFIMNYYGGHIGWSDVFSLAGTGRWLTIIANNLAGHWFKTPFFKGIWILVLVGLTAVLFTRLFSIRWIAGGALVGAVLAVSPATQAYITLRDTAYAVSVLLCVWGVSILVRSWDIRGILLGGLCCGLGLSIMPANLSVILTLIVLYLLTQLLTKPEVTARRILIRGLEGLAACAAGGVILLAGTFLVTRFFEVPVSSYQGAEAAMTGGFVRNLLPAFVQTFKKFIVMGIWKAQIDPWFVWTLFGSYLADICLVLALAKHRRLSGDPGKLALLVFLIAMVIPSLCAMTLLSYGFMYRGQHRAAFYFLLLLPVPLMERFLAERNTGIPERRKKRAALLLLVNFVCMVYGLALYDNIGYMAQDYVMSQDRAYCTRILASLDREKEMHGEAPVYFVNATDWDADAALTPMKEEWALYSVIWPVATSNLYCYQDDSFRAFCEVYLGVRLEKPEEEVACALEETCFQEAMALEAGAFEVRYLPEYGVYVILVKTVMPPNVLYG